MDIKQLIIKNIKKNKIPFIEFVVCFVLSSVALTITPFFTSRIIGCFESGSKETVVHNVIFWLILFFVFKLLQAINQYFARITNTTFDTTLITNISSDLFKKVHQHNISYFDDEMTGRISTAINKTSQLMQTLFINILFSFFRPLINFLFAFIIIADASIKLALCLTFLCIPFFFILFHLTKKVMLIWKQRGSLEREYLGVVTDSMTNHKLVHYTGSIFSEKLYAFSFLRKYLKNTYDCESQRAFLRTVLNLMETCFTISCYITIIYFAAIDSISLANAFFAFSSVIMLDFALRDLSGFFKIFFECYGELTSHIELINKPIAIKDKPDAKRLNIKKADISFKHVEFAYVAEKKIFKNLNLTIKAGEKIGLVGFSGAGKSTLISLLMRLYQPQKGEICINRHNIADVTELSLHQNISYVPQDVTLFNRSLYENLKIGNPKATRQQIIKAAQQAYIDETIKKLENGYDSVVGERGILLSGGERQRIAIARAILQNAPILILDEATSALDSQAEVMIQNALKNLMKNKTVIAIAHRLSTLRSMDRIIVLDHGKIVEDGSPQELLNNDSSLFKHLYDLQTNGYLPDEQ